MATTDPELDFLIEHRERELAFQEAKEEGGDRWQEEKVRMREWRRYWREIRAAFASEPEDGDAVAAPETLKVKGKVNS